MVAFSKNIHLTAAELKQAVAPQKPGPCIYIGMRKTSYFIELHCKSLEKSYIHIINRQIN